MPKKRVIAFIQARMGASRLPGKVLMDVGGYPMLERVVQRLRCCRNIDEVIIATTTQPEDNAVVSFCENHELCYFRGSEKDVLDRYYQAALNRHADVVVRITGDCPLIDSEVTDNILAVFLSACPPVAGATNVVKRTYPRGLDTEVISFDALMTAWKLADKPYQREHVTPFIYENPQLFEIRHVMQDIDLSNWRWTVDEPLDLEFVRQIYLCMGDKGKDVFGFRDIVALIKENSFLADINKSVRQKPVGGH